MQIKSDEEQGWEYGPEVLVEPFKECTLYKVLSLFGL